MSVECPTPRLEFGAGSWLLSLKGNHLIGGSCPMPAFQTPLVHGSHLVMNEIGLTFGALLVGALIACRYVYY